MLEEFKVQNAPAAMQELVQKHNALVELIGMMRGVNGIYTHVSRGGIVLSANPTGLAGTGQPASNGASGNVGGTIQAVGSNGTLFEVVQPVSPNAPAGYPTLLRVTTNTSNRTSMTGTEIIAEDTSSGAYAALGMDFFELYNGNLLSIDSAQLTQDMFIMTWVGCNSGSPGNYLAITSDFF